MSSATVRAAIVAVIVSFIVAAQGQVPAGSASNSVPSLSLAEAQRLAFQRNWDLLAARSDVDFATAQRIVSREFPNPTLSASTTKMSTDRNPNSTTLGNSVWNRSYDTLVAVNQLFEIGGKRASRQASAAAGIKASEARLQEARRTLSLGVTQAYVAAILADEGVQILRQSSGSLRQEARIAETRLNAGDISRAEKSQIEIAADRLELDAQASEANARSARIALEVLLGEKNPQGNWQAADSLQTLAETAPPTSPVMDGTRPDLAAAEALQKKAEADLRLQKAMRVPDPTVFLQYEHEPPDLPNTIGLGVSFPLPLWNRNRGNIKAAEAAREQAAVQAGKLRAQVAADIAISRNNFTSALDRWHKQRDLVQPKSAEVRSTVEFAYQKGGASLLDLLTAERNDNEIRLATAQAAADTAQAAAALRAALSVMEPGK
jgi:cobalt-zinc-cadmium efflux system outer membrane protein